MRDSKGFDIWADEYNSFVQQSKGSYPFDGYDDVLNTIYDTIGPANGKIILDIGIGTGTLTQRFYNDGAKIYGIDFSGEMLKKSGEKMPFAVLIRHDFSNGLPPELKATKFDAVISTYAMHHLNDDKKIELLAEIKQNLVSGGVILIGDVAFETENDLLKCKEANGSAWDNDEYYMAADKIKNMLIKNGISSKYRQISSCAGVLMIK